MKKTVLNITLLSLLSLPCLLALNDESPITGEYNLLVNIFGIIYCVWFAKCVVRKVFKDLPEPE